MPGRGCTLVNDRRDLERAPLASPTALRHALRALAARIRPERDIVFLAISSHGSEGTIAVSNGVFVVRDLQAEDLAAALNDAGIVWRVIVISACHSGSFIDALRDPRAIVLTAAAADKTSFGCSDDRDLTYFGEAFLEGPFGRGASLQGAFESARKTVAKWEQEERLTPSDPQAYVGKNMRELWAESARR